MEINTGAPEASLQISSEDDELKALFQMLQPATHDLSSYIEAIRALGNADSTEFVINIMDNWLLDPVEALRCLGVVDSEISRIDAENQRFFDRSHFLYVILDHVSTDAIRLYLNNSAKDKYNEM